MSWGHITSRGNREDAERLKRLVAMAPDHVKVMKRERLRSNIYLEDAHGHSVTMGIGYFGFARIVVPIKPDMRLGSGICVWSEEHDGIRTEQELMDIAVSALKPTVVARFHENQTVKNAGLSPARDYITLKEATS